MTRLVRDRRALWLAVGLLLLIWVLRLTGIALFPPFIDETIHIRTGEQILQNGTPFLNVDLGRQLSIWWLMLFQPAAASPMWVARAGTILAALPGIAALFASARLIGGRWAMGLFGLFYALSTYHAFFERLALADPIAATPVSLAVYFGCRLARRVALRDALLTGISLFAAFAAKSSAAPYFGIPLAAVLTVPRAAIAPRLRWLAAALGSTFALFALFVLVTRLRGYDIITNTLTLAVSGRGMVDSARILSPLRILDNARLTVENLAGYFGAIPLIVMLACVVVLLVRRRWYLPLCLLGPVLVIWLNTAQETRYLVTPVALLLLCGAVVLASIPRARWAALALTLVWGAFYWLPFWMTTVRSPQDVPLPSADASQYLHSDSTGFGFAQIYALLSAQDTPPTQIIGALSNCQGLRFAAPPELYHKITCPLVRPGGQDKADLAALFDASRSAGTYLVLEASPYVPESAPGALISVIDAGRPALSVYDLAP